MLTKRPSRQRRKKMCEDGADCKFQVRSVEFAPDTGDLLEGKDVAVHAVVRCS